MLIQWGVDRQRAWAQPSSEGGGGRWIVVIHGGAWRDPLITHESAFNLLSHLDRSNIGGVASIDYRISPDFQHPCHMEDVAQGIREICSRFNPSSIVLVGHSCGAFLSGQVSAEFPQLVSGVVCVEGIHDLKLLVEEYPDYRGFVADAFGDDWPVIDWSKVPIKAIVHSKQDELLSMKQPSWLSEISGVQIYLQENGKHDEVYEKLGNEWGHTITDN